MDYEKKYNEAQKWIESIYSELSHEQQMEAEAFFPELKESEDEKVEKAIFGMVYDSDNELWSSYDVSKSDVLAWLEKQGEYKSPEEVLKIRQELYQSGYNDGYKHGCEDSKKQSEQKPSNKVEPKFKVGDWIISNNKKSIYQVIEVKRGIYVIRDNADNYEYHIGIEECEKSGRFFTIQDAKDGDVLASDNSIFIFSQEYIVGKPEAYCGIMNGLFIAKSEGCWTNEECYPATKSQRDTLFAKMKESGYEWNAEKKLLKKIEQKPQRMISAEAKEALYDKPVWSEEDEDAIGMAIIALEDMYDEDSPDITYGGHNLPFNKAAERLKLLKDRVVPQPKQEWSEEDEEYINDLIGVFDGQQYQAHSDEEVVNWLKSIRLQCNKEWGKRDEEMLKSIIATCELACEDRDSSPARHLLKMQTNWLKSLKQRIGGKV